MTRTFDAMSDDVADLPADSPQWRAALATNHPGYDFEQYSVGIGFKWSATALHLGIHPWCVVTGDPREFGAHLRS
jgi:hypothetical protein